MLAVVVEEVPQGTVGRCMLGQLVGLAVEAADDGLQGWVRLLLPSPAWAASLSGSQQAVQLEVTQGPWLQAVELGQQVPAERCHH